MEVKEPAIAYGKQKISIDEYLEMENASSESREIMMTTMFLILLYSLKFFLVPQRIMTVVKNLNCTEIFQH